VKVDLLRSGGAAQSRDVLLGEPLLLLRGQRRAPRRGQLLTERLHLGARGAQRGVQGLAAPQLDARGRRRLQRHAAQLHDPRLHGVEQPRELRVAVLLPVLLARQELAHLRVGVAGQRAQPLGRGARGVLGADPRDLKLLQAVRRGGGQRDGDASHRPPLHCSPCRSIARSATLSPACAPPIERHLSRQLDQQLAEVWMLATGVCVRRTEKPLRRAIGRARIGDAASLLAGQIDIAGLLHVGRPRPGGGGGPDRDHRADARLMRLQRLMNGPSQNLLTSPRCGSM
jgi:hypothetical protein